MGPAMDEHTSSRTSNSRRSSNPQPIRGDGAGRSSSRSSTSKFASMRKMFGSFRRKKNKDRVRGGDEEQEEGQVASAGSLSSVDKSGSTVEDAITTQDEVVNNTRINVKQFVRQGLADPNLRHRTWTVMAGVDIIMLEREGEYDSLIGKSERLNGGEHWVSHRFSTRVHSCQSTFIVILTLHFSPLKDPMERDLRKNLPNHKFFRDVRKREYVSNDGNEEEKLDISTSSRGSNYVGEEMGKKALRRILRAYSVYDAELGYCRGMSCIVSKMNTLFSSEQYI